MSNPPSMPAATPDATTPRRLWVAPLVWAIHFLAIYGFTALACERQTSVAIWGASVIVWFIGALTLAAVLILVVTIRGALRDGRRAIKQMAAASRFAHWLTAAVATLVLVAVIWEALPVFFMPICG
jgi:hypothetical protein